MIGIFPNEESLVRTMGAVLIEESHQRQSGRALFSSKTFKEFMTPEIIKTLIEIANEQQRVMAAQAAFTRCCSFAISISVFMTSGVMNSLKVLGLKRALPDCL